MAIVDANILGIESSCDETAAAVVRNGREVLSNVVASQNDVHRKYGGVVPELASREHLRSIVPVVREALERAGLAFATIDAVGVTRGPGLVGSLLVGVTYGKAIAQAAAKPLVGVNHLEGHVRAVILESESGGIEPQLPAVCLIVSGGHTQLYLVTTAQPGPLEEIPFRYTCLGQTRDDAAGEAYDKVAKLLAFGYPGGPVIDRLAARGNPSAVRFGEPRMKGNPYDFSFSGLKTAVLYHVRAHPELDPEISARRAALADGRRAADDLVALSSAHTLDLLASFQRAVVGNLVGRTLAAAGQWAAASVLVTGGVAANRELRETFQAEAGRRNLPVFFPSRALSTDNAAMIAAAAYPRLVAGEVAGTDLDVHAVLPLA